MTIPPPTAPDPFAGMTDRALLMLAAGCLQSAAAMSSALSSARELAKFRRAMAELDRRFLADGLERLTQPGNIGTTQ